MTRKSLTDYAKSETIRTGPTAWVETIPEWPEVLDAYRSGVRMSVIRRWLINECGYEEDVATYQRVSHLYNKYGGNRG
mgnify:FL=1